MKEEKSLIIFVWVIVGNLTLTRDNVNS